ncbi:WbqC family protein [Fluviicola sp.]|uniref:WbqC family protein n=1 Tax=Fluviicola sp. TaxID=1917219 RepID=UPI002612E65E|nr:WbqC family protein [Fluviicola sp.]
MDAQAIFPIAYFGSVRYFQDLVKHGQIAFETCDHFPKQTFRNRMVILGSQGPQILTMPLERPNGSKTITRDVLVSYQQNWPLIHWKALKTAYSSAPYFEHYASDIEQLLFQKHRFLVDFDQAITQFFLTVYQLPVSTSYTEAYHFSHSLDFRNSDYELLEMDGKYTQVLFGEKHFHTQVSILDLLFCEGPIGRKTII